MIAYKEGYVIFIIVTYVIENPKDVFTRSIDKLYLYRPCY